MLGLVFFLIVFYIGLQIYIGDIIAFSHRINYRLTVSQYITLFFLILGISLILIDIVCFNYQWCVFLFSFFSVIFFILSEWFLAKLSVQNFWLNWIIRLVCLCIVYFYYSINYNEYILLPSILYGFYIRNTPFGAVHNNLLYLNKLFKRKCKDEYELKDIVKDFDNFRHYKYVGNENEVSKLPSYSVCDYGLKPNSKKNSIELLQSIIDTIGKNNGGLIYFPKGKYYFNCSNSNFIQINYSNIILEGETDSYGNPLVELVCCSNTLNGDKNPWLSPFFITTGERLQKSNIFWGLQFKNKKHIVTRSGSLADPGSDGTILSPDYITDIIEDADVNTDILKVKDVSKVGKYILVGLYNVDSDALIKEILGTNIIKKEWQTALRAKDEVAPSYQWLVEVKRIIDKNTIQLVRPLLRKIKMQYSPSIFNVDMLENISIKNLIISSKWNGLFRHHGFPLYFSVKQSQEMDYGWNAINMKRVAHGNINNVIIKNFTNPLYIMDSRNLTIENIVIKGYDGHQGIKIYEHACDNLFRNITFYNHYADMLGGEGNAYSNVFTNIKYLNPVFKPVDFDFHGFSEGPMSPPANNLFECIYGFRYIKTAAAMYNLPGCARNNIWWNIYGEGERINNPLFISLPYVRKNGILIYLSSLSRAIISAIQQGNYRLQYIKKMFLLRVDELKKTSLPIEEHQSLYHDIYLYGYLTKASINEEQKDIYWINQNSMIYPFSVYDYVSSQRES